MKSAGLWTEIVNIQSQFRVNIKKRVQSVTDHTSSYYLEYKGDDIASLNRLMAIHPAAHGLL